MTEKLALGVDLGGTKIAFALVTEKGEVVASHRLPTPVLDGAEAVFKQIAAGIQHLVNQAKKPIVGIGIGSPGHLNPHTGLIHNASNLAWRDVNLLEGVRRHFETELPMWLQKDANTSALSELYFGAAQGYSDFVIITIGTGLGGGAVVAGEIVDGADYSGMEIGHMPLNPNGRICVCGMHGCPEMYVSGVGILAGAHEYLPNYPDSSLAGVDEITTEAILNAFQENDRLAIRLIDEMADWLSSVMIACMGILNPALFVIGGGLGHAVYDDLKSRVREKIRSRTRREIHREVPIVESTIKDTAMGPASIVWHKLKDVST
jgi:glucokinase